MNEVDSWAGIIRSDKPHGRLGRVLWRRRWQKAEARAFLYGTQAWYATLQAANHRAGVWGE
jgi:hypothetical protein